MQLSITIDTNRMSVKWRSINRKHRGIIFHVVTSQSPLLLGYRLSTFQTDMNMRVKVRMRASPAGSLSFSAAAVHVVHFHPSVWVSDFALYFERGAHLLWIDTRRDDTSQTASRHMGIGNLP